MPFPALLRRNRKSDVHIRRHSVIVEPSESAAYPDAPPLPLRSPFGRKSDLGQRPHLGASVPTNLSVAGKPHGDNSDHGDDDALQPPSLPGRPRPLSGLVRFRHASDSQLSTSARSSRVPTADGDDPGPAPAPQPADMPPMPAIITTAPTSDMSERASTTRSPRSKLPGYFKTPKERRLEGNRASRPEVSLETHLLHDDASPQRVGAKSSRKSAHLSGKPSALPPAVPPPPYGDESSSSLAIPLTRLSESSRSDGSLGERIAFSTTTTTQTVSTTTTTIFRLPRRRKQTVSPAPDTALPSVNGSANSFDPATSGIPETSLNASVISEDMVAEVRRYEERAGSITPSPSISSFSLRGAVTGTSGLRDNAQILRQGSTHSAHSTRSTPALAPPARIDGRERSPTAFSLNDELRRSTPSLLSGRASTATTGRSSLGGMFNVSSKLRPSIDSTTPRHGSPGTPATNASKPNSLSLPRETIVIPEREPNETPAKYLARLQEAVNRDAIAGILARSDDAFSHAVLRSYMRSFAFFEDPIDMAIRKLLMKVELPKETQQIDRVLQKFADRYHECNPGIFSSADQAYFVAFSLLILQTDAFNKNNKRKMQKQDYIRNTHDYGDGLSEDILACFYDNICYTPFIHVDCDDLDMSSDRRLSRKPRRSMFPRPGVDLPRKMPKEPIDPYTLIIDNRLDFLRPNLRDVMNGQDPYKYLGTAKSLDVQALQKAFHRWAVLQIMSARSRPDAFMSPMTITNPQDAHPGVVDIKVTKVGILWRKEAKKKKTRSPWQEWGAILTGSQLYFFRNAPWVKNLLHQCDLHQRSPRAGSLLVFKPPLDSFKPDALMSTDDAVALLDTSYKKHKNAFVFVRHGGFEETFLAESEADMNDWLAKLNYSAAFRTAGVRMRAVMTPSADAVAAGAAGTRRQTTNGSNISSASSSVSAVTAATVRTRGGGSGGDYAENNSSNNALTQQILFARRQIIRQKILEANEKLAVAQKQRDHQLRNSRHLQILAPIQAKSREQIILAAGRMAAKLKWIRMEIWRVKCHRDILLLDLEDEGYSLDDVEHSRGDAGRIPAAEDSVAAFDFTNDNPNDLRRASCATDAHTHSDADAVTAI